MTTGSDHVLGELWHFDQSNCDTVQATLDRIEGANQPGHPDLYRRVVQPVYALDGQRLDEAFVYLYDRNPSADGFAQISSDESDKFVRWP